MEINKIRKNSRRGAVISLVGFCLIFGGFITAGIHLNNLNNEIYIANDSLAVLKNRIDFSVENIEKLESKKNNLEKEFHDLTIMSLNSFGWSKNELVNIDIQSERVTEALKANNQIRNLMFHENISVDHSIGIEYYKKVSDNKKVDIALEELGFKIHHKQSSSKVSDKSTNTIVFGTSVPLDYVKLVAFTLIRAGIPIKHINENKMIGKNKIALWNTTTWVKQTKQRIEYPNWKVSEIDTTSNFMNINRPKKVID